MTADKFRELALSLPDTAEASHRGHPDFRVHGRIFATLFYPDEGWGTVNLPVDEQQTICAAQPKMFRPVAGGWGRMGSTNVLLAAVTERELKLALQLAWQHIAARAKDGKASKRAAKRV